MNKILGRTYTRTYNLADGIESGVLQKRSYDSPAPIVMVIVRALALFAAQAVFYWWLTGTAGAPTALRWIWVGIASLLLCLVFLVQFKRSNHAARGFHDG